MKDKKDEYLTFLTFINQTGNYSGGIRLPSRPGSLV